MKSQGNRSQISHDEIIRRYQAGDPCTVLAKEAGILTTRVFKILIRNNVPRRSIQEVSLRKRKHDYRLIRDDYESGINLNELAKKYDSDPSGVRKMIIAAGGTMRPPGYSSGSRMKNWKPAGV